MKARVDIVSGVLGAGKTTYIKRLIADVKPEDRVVVIQNEYGAEQIQGTEIKDTGISIEGLSSGCVCCQGTTNFVQSLQTIVEWMSPKRIILEPAGTGKLSDIISTMRSSCSDYAEPGDVITIVDAGKHAVYIRNYDESYGDQIAAADHIVLSKVDKAGPEKLQAVLAQIHELNPRAEISEISIDAE